MKEFLRKIRRKFVFSLATAIVMLMLVPSIAYAYDYYGGTDANHVTPGSEYNAIAPGNSRTTIPYYIKIIVRRGVPGHFGGNTTISEARVKNYTGDRNVSEKFSDWGYLDYKNSWNHWKNPYGEANGFNTDDDKVVNNFPAMWSNLHLGSDGVVYYDCPNCGAKAYYVDFVQYGYYDKNLNVRYTGYSGYQFCPTCNKGDEANTGKRGVKVGNTTIGQQVGSYEGPASSANSFQGVYTYPEIKNGYGKYLITTDPAYAGLGYTTTYASWLQMMKNKTYNVSLGNNIYAEGNGSISYIDASRNGYWIKNSGNGKIHTLSGGTTSNPGKDVALWGGSSYNIKITEVKGNNQNIDFGQHFFKKYYSQIYFTAWNLCNHGECIHTAKYDNIYGPLYYNGQSIGKGGWNYVNDLGKCGHKYEKGYIGICADCGEAVTALTYASPETLASFRQVENGVEYYYFCPAQIGNFNLGGKIFYYLHSQVENQWPFMHACYAISKNQYQLKFVPNLPSGVTGDAWEYTLDKYFYNTFTDGTDIEYVANDVTVPYGESVPTLKSRNSIPSPTWDVPGFKFSGWEVYVGNNNLGREVWVALPTNKQTWQEVCNILENNKDALGNVYNSLSNDMATIKLRATWEGYNRNVYIRDESESGAILNASNPYVVGYGKSQTISALGNKSGILTCVQSGDVPGISLSNVVITTSKPFDSFRKATTPAFYGSFDKLSSSYTNDVLNRNDVYLVSEYHWESVVLPTPSLQTGYMFMGWYTGKNGTGAFVGNGGASYTPSSANETLYAYWKPDSMTIGAVVIDHAAGRSNVSWTYSNATVNGTAYYKIYRADNGSSTWNLITNGNTVGNNVSTTSVNETKTADGSYTVVTDGLYSIEIQGAKGGNGNGTKSGGNGGKVSLTVMLKAGDVLAYNVANNHYNSNASFSNGGNTNYCGGAATAIYLNNQLLAVAGGGGAASNSVNGSAGGIATSSTGNYYGTNSHSHAVGGGSSEWNSTYGTVYPSSGGCYTRAVTVETQVKCPGTYSYQDWASAENPYTESSGYSDHNSHTSGYYYGEVKCSNYANCGKVFSGFNVRCGCGLITAGDGKDTSKMPGDYYYEHYISSTKTMYALKTDCNEYAGSGGYSYVNTSLTTSNSVTGGTNNSTIGSVNIKSVVIGVTTKTSLVDENTDDKIGPSAPTIKTFTLTTNVNSSNSSRVDVVTDIVEWAPAIDRGTPYSYRGETWDIRSMKTQTAVCATTQNANVTVTSGIESYYYKIDTNPTASNTSSGWTKFNGTTLKNTVSVDANQNPNANYNKDFYLHVFAMDKAGNKGEVANKPCNMSWIYTIPPHNTHIVGAFEYVNVSIPSIGNGSYIDNSVSPARVYLKADGITSLMICGNASLSPENQSRITTVTVGTGLRNGFTFECPLRDYQKNSAMVNGNVTSTFRSAGNETIETFATANNKNSVSYYANFTTTSENATTITAYAQAKCLGDENGCAKANHILNKTGNSYVLVGDKTAPKVTIGGQSFQGENAGEYTYDWNSGKTISISSIDTGSGIKTVVVKDSLSGNTASNKNYSARVTTDTTSFSSTTSGEYSYEVVVIDNVGNKTTFKINEKIDNDNPYIKDVTSDISSSKVYASIAGTWPTTNKSTSWEYDWFSSEKWISYNAYDMTSDIKSFKMYSSDASKTKGTLLKEGEAKEDVLGLQIDYKVTTEGTSYYLLEAIDSNNHVVVVHITARLDTFVPYGASASHTSISLEDKTPSEATSIVNGNAGSDALTSIIWNVTWQDFSNASRTAKDSSGIIKSELYIYDENDPSIAKKYDMNVSSYGGRTIQNTSNWNPTDRYFEVSYSKQVNTFVDFPTSGSLKWRIVGYDNVGNTCVIEGPDVIKNYLVKAVAYTTKSNGYNISTDNGNLPYFKTGEVGYVEVWTIGYVEKLELDFSEGGIGQEAADAISNGSLQKKYNLGVKGSNNERIIANLYNHKPASSTVPDNSEGYAYASHYVYAASDVNNSLGTDSEIDGWNEYGTMIRIPPNHLLVEKDQTDKYGNALFNWETHEIGVIAHKKGSSSTTKAYYVIWDEAGDDLHYRIIHETMGF